MSRREEILNGELLFPRQILEILNPDDRQKEIISDFWNNVWHNYLREKTVDTVTWFECFNDKKFFNSLLLHLSRSGWVNSVVDNNYAYVELNDSKLLKWIDKEEIINLKFKYKSMKYRLTKSKSVLNDVVQINGKHIPTGLVRNGFMKTGNHKFQYDTKYIQKYLNGIAFQLEKGLTSSSKDITYQEIIEELTDYYSVVQEDLTLGNCLIDSRGRSIFQCSKKIFNPVSSKEARALLITKPQSLDSEAFKAIYAAIAELNGYRGKNYEDKIKTGESMYVMREKPSYQKMIESQDYDELHALIWLERIYDNLDSYEETKQWVVPIELDALASLMQLTGVLLNNKEYMDGTNLIGSEFKDIWTVPYVSRKHVKKALTPKLYGSSKSPKELWDNNKLSYTTQQLNKITRDLTIGRYSEANKFKDFIINNVAPKTKMKVKIWNEEFNIECNRFRWEETTQKYYFIYNTENQKMKKIIRTVHMVPDTNQFKRYFQTLLLHNLDSQVANFICEQLDWVIPNHDAFTVHPVDAVQVKELYRKKMYEIYKNRRTILQNYLTSIGIDKTYEEKDTEEVAEFQPNCLK